MMKKSAMRLVLYSVTAALLGVVAVQGSLARERFGHRVTAHSVQSSPAKTANDQRPTTGSKQAGTEGRETLDVPMTVWRRGEGRQTSAPKTQNIRIVPIAHPHPPAAPAALNFAHRNAIGLEVTRGDMIERNSIQSYSRPPMKPGSVPASAIGSVANRSMGGMPTAGANSKPNFTTLSRGGIGGPTTGLGTPRPGVGGPTRLVAGINGSTFPPKR